jgi:BlaI family penicillinase repressor
MATPIRTFDRVAPRRSLLELAPLELACMNALWPLGEASVRQVRESLAARKPRAYTTIMTILDRLAQKGIVARRKVGRAYLYQANLRPADAQEHAVEQVVEGFFGGSRQALAAHLAGQGDPIVKYQVSPPARVVSEIAPGATDEPAEEIEPVVPEELDRTLL